MEGSAYTDVTLEIFEAVQRVSETPPWRFRLICTAPKMI